jgi:PAS domain S-box-containing protein
MAPAMHNVVMNEATIPLLATVEPGRAQRRTVLVVLAVSVIVFLAAAPYAKLQLPAFWAFLPVYQSAYVVVTTVTAILLIGQFRVQRSWSLLILAEAYVFDALMAVAHALSFPGLFAPAGLLGAGPQTTAWLYFMWHGGFPLFVTGYAFLKGRPHDALRQRTGSAAAMFSVTAFMVALAGGMTLLATRGHDLLPAIMHGDLDAPTKFSVAVVTWLISVVALAGLWLRRPHSLLDSWLMAVVCIWIFDSALAAVLNHGRFDVGWNAGRIYGLVAGSLVLGMLLIENSALVVQLARLRADELRRSRARLSESETRFRLTFDLAAIGIAHVSLEGRWLRVNPKLCDMLGYGEDELRTMKFQDLTHPDDLEATLAHMRQMLAGEIRVCTFEMRYIRKDCAVAWAHLTVSVAPKADGTPDYFISVVEDITARRSADDELRTLRQETERLMRFQVAGQTVSALAHELNQPLNAVSTYAAAALRMLSGGDLNADKLRHALEGSAEQAQRAGQVVRDLMAYLNKGGISAEPIDLTGMIQEVVDQVRTNYRDRIRFRTELASSLPAVSANRLQVEKVLGNLIDNGIEAMRDAGVPDTDIVVTVRSNDDGGMAQVSVRDSGPGIDSQLLRRIFEPFFTTKPRGLGMGLAISRAIIEAHGGQLWVESQPGAGAVFHFTLPFAP